MDKAEVSVSFPHVVSVKPETPPPQNSILLRKLILGESLREGRPLKQGDTPAPQGCGQEMNASDSEQRRIKNKTTTYGRESKAGVKKGGSGAAGLVVAAV